MTFVKATCVTLYVLSGINVKRILKSEVNSFGIGIFSMFFHDSAPFIGYASLQDTPSSENDTFNALGLS